MQWRAFVQEGKTYDLSHLWPRTCVYEQPASKDKPSHKYTVEVHFGLHSFTRGLDEDESLDPGLRYSDAREARVFDFARHELSKLLPSLVEQLPSRKCYHTGKGNFFAIEAVDQQGQRVEYFVFFEASRTTKRGVLRLFVQSAYVRKEDKPKRKPIGFYVVLFNTLNNKPIKVPA